MPPKPHRDLSPASGEEYVTALKKVQARLANTPAARSIRRVLTKRREKAAAALTRLAAEEEDARRARVARPAPTAQEARDRAAIAAEMGAQMRRIEDANARLAQAALDADPAAAATAQQARERAAREREDANGGRRRKTKRRARKTRRRHK